MAKKKSSKKKDTQDHNFKFPEYMEVTPEDRKVISEIGNPYLISYLLGLLCVIVGVGLALIGRTVFSNDSFVQFYYYLFAGIGIVFGIAEYIFTIRKDLNFRKFLKRDKYRIIWTYPEKKYEEFYHGLKENEGGIKQKRFLYAFGFLILLTLLLFATSQGATKITAIAFGIICIGIVFVVGFLLPRTYIWDAKKKPYITLLDDDAAFALGRFCRWDKALVTYRKLNKVYGTDAQEMRITYQEPYLLMKKTPTFQVLLPNNDQYTYLYARRVGKRINKERKLLTENPEQKENFIERLYNRLMNRTDELDNES